MASKPSLETLCGFSGDETEVNLSNKGLSTGCAVLVANEVKNNGALTSLNMSNNNIGAIDSGGWFEHQAVGLSSGGWFD